MIARISALLLLLIASHGIIAQEKERLVGIWKLTSFDTEFQATGERRAVFGKNPKGYIIFTPEGRMMALITGDGRKPAETDPDRAALFRSMFAYSGIYHVETDKFTTKVDISWNEAWTGTEQVRFYKLEGEQLHIISAWAQSSLPERPVVRGILTWEKVKESR
jgi:hypothetical protein